MAVFVQKVRVNGRRYVDLVDLERFLRRVEHENPGITLEGYVNHVVETVCKDD